MAFEPGPVVLMYTCGITPYDASHLGHAATYLTYDILQRRLRDRGHETRCVRNLTDVDDDILRKARELGVHYLDLAAAETARFQADMAALGLLPSWSEPRATSAIADIRGFIGMVLDRGHAYEAGGAVYFDISTFERFGQVSHLTAEEMLPLAAERGGNPDDPNKRNPLDFVLWQPSADDEPAWDSLWGPGRPGWHIECSALALRELGTTIDLHGGGSDLIYPPPRVRGRAVRGGDRRTVRPPLDAPGHGPHGRREDVQVPGQPGLRQRPAQDLGRPGHPPRRAGPPLPGLLELERRDHARRGRARWRPGRRRERATAALEEVRAALDADLDTPGALAAVDQAAAAGRGVSEAAALLGVDLAE